MRKQSTFKFVVCEYDEDDKHNQVRVATQQDLSNIFSHDRETHYEHDISKTYSLIDNIIENNKPHTRVDNKMIVDFDMIRLLRLIKDVVVSHFHQDGDRDVFVCVDHEELI